MKSFAQGKWRELTAACSRRAVVDMRVQIDEREEELMGIGSMLKMTLTPTPRWPKKVEANGSPASATVLSDPKKVIEGVAGYRGKDGWIDFEADVLTEVGEHFTATAKCRLSQALGGMMEQGLKVNVRYDPKDGKRVVLVDDVPTLLNYRLKPQ